MVAEKLSIEQRRDGTIAGKLGFEQGQFFRIRSQFNRGAFVVLALLSLIWVVVWLRYFRDVPTAPPLTAEELATLPARNRGDAATFGTRPGSPPDSSSEDPQPSSNATRRSLSKRPVSLLTAPRPLRRMTLPGISMPDIMPIR